MSMGAAMLRHFVPAGAASTCTGCSARQPRMRTISRAAALDTAMPDFLPPELAQIQEPAARSMAARMQRVPLAVPSLPNLGPLDTAYVGPAPSAAPALAAAALLGAAAPPPLVMLHGFDSSCLEFRRLLPRLEPRVETYAVDLVCHFAGGAGHAAPSMWRTTGQHPL